MHTGEHMSLFIVCRTAAQIFSVVFTLFRPSEMSCFTNLQQSHISSLCPNWFPQMWDSLPCFSFPTPGCKSGLTCSHPPSTFFSFILLIYGWICVILSICQRLLLVFSQCSIRIIASVHIFLIHLWREIHSFSTYFSTILAPLFLKFSIYLPFDLEDKSIKH